CGGNIEPTAETEKWISESCSGGCVSRRKSRTRRLLRFKKSVFHPCPSVAKYLLMNPSLRAAVIAEWRGLPERRMRADRWQLPAELVPKMMQRLGLRERLH